MINLLRNLFRKYQAQTHHGYCEYCNKSVSKAQHTILTKTEHAKVFATYQFFENKYFCDVHCMAKFIQDYKLFHKSDITIKTYLIKNKTDKIVFEAVLTQLDNQIIFEITEQSDVLTASSRDIYFVGTKVVSNQCVEIKHDGNLQLFIKGADQSVNHTKIHISNAKIMFEEVNKLLNEFISVCNKKLNPNAEFMNSILPIKDKINKYISSNKE